MKERPIIFSAESVRAILVGRKTQTRRMMKPQPRQLPSGVWTWKETKWCEGRALISDRAPIDRCPYGVRGDRLWVRETFSYREYGCSRIERLQNFHYWADDEVKFGIWSRPVSPIFMPRWASRITLEITGIRVERVQEISEEDARAEGVKPDKETGSYRDSFMVLWDRLNAKRGFGWDKNPWVWVVGVKRIEEEGGA